MQYKLATIDMDYCILETSGRGYIIRKYDSVAGTDLSRESDSILEKLRSGVITRKTAVEKLEQLVSAVPVSLRRDTNFYNELQVREGFNEFIKYLKKHSINSVIITIGDPHVAEYIANKYKIDKSVHRTDDEKLHAYQNFCNKLGIRESQTICVGDSPHDIFSDCALKIKILRNDKKESFSADVECKDFCEALNFLINR